MAKAEASVANIGPEGNTLTRVAAWPQKVKEYFEDLKAEMRKVTWPSWPQVRATTAVVLGAVFAFAFYFAVVDMLLGRAIKRVFDTFAK